MTLFRTAVGTVTEWYTSCCAMAKRALPEYFVVLAAVHGSLGLPGWRLRLSLQSFFPFPAFIPKWRGPHPNARMGELPNLING